MSAPLIPLPQHSKLTRRTINKLVSLLEKGNIDKVACAGAGIAESTFYLWMDLARELVVQEDYTPTSEYERNALELLEATTRAREKAEEDAVAAVKNAILGYDSEEVTEEIWYSTDDKGEQVEHKTTKTKRWHTAPDARIALDMLSRRNPQSWAKKADIEINNNQNNLILNADDIAAALAQVLAKKQDTLRNYPELTDGDD